MNGELYDLLRGAENTAILVLGDIMLDRYVWGEINRISPEAPVPVLETSDETETLGGAANVALNLRALGAKRVLLAGVTGADETGRKIADRLRSAGIDSTAVITDPARPTSVKTRIVAGHQQIMRIDRETRDALTKQAEARLLAAVTRALKSCDGIIISDYGKGVLSRSLLKSVITSSAKSGVPVFVDPKGKDFSKYKGAFAITPNKKEAAEAAGFTIDSEKDYRSAASSIMKTAACKAVLVTRGAEGISLFEKSGRHIFIPAEAREVYDVSGAGDTVISAFGLLASSGAPLDSAVTLANIAAGIEVGKLGTSAVSRDEIARQMENSLLSSGGKKIIDRQEAAQIAASIRSRGKKIVFTNGCFDLIHVGHIKYLQKARKLGDVMFIGLNSDDSVRQLKGPSRPLLDEYDRSHILAALDCVDYVVPFSELDPLELIKTVRPDFLVKGADYKVSTVVGAEFVKSHGGKVVLVELEAGKSTTGIVDKIIKNHASKPRTGKKRR